MYAKYFIILFIFPLNLNIRQTNKQECPWSVTDVILFLGSYTMWLWEILPVF
jgi:hypothetical protein